MKIKVLLILIGVIFLINPISAYTADVAYIYTNQPEPIIINEMDNLGISHIEIFHDDVLFHNLSDFKMILINNDYFVNWKNIPINNVRSLVVGSESVVNWGWTTRATLKSTRDPLYVGINTSHEITPGFNDTIKAYNSPRVYFHIFDKMDVYNGFEIISFLPPYSKNVVVALAREGTTLTKSGHPNTQINADSIFFGLHDANYWTKETKQLFENCLLFLTRGEQTEFNIPIKQGQNLISFPLITNSTPTQLKVQNPKIISIKTYNNGIIDAPTLQNNKGYFVEASSDFNLTITGTAPRETQNVQLNSGMNLVGITSLSNISLDNLPSDIIEVAEKKEDRSYNIASKYGTWFNAFELEPGKGYWFKTKTAGVWSYTP